MSKTNKITIISLLIISVILIATNITFALMGDRKVQTGIIQFKEHKLNIEIVGDDSIILSPEELNLGSVSTRTINITNPQTSTSCVFRIWFEFLIEGETNTEYLTFSIDDSNFTSSESGKYYYNQVLATGGKVNNISLKFMVANDVAFDDYQGKKYNIKLYVESIQANKTAIEQDWSSDYKPEWYQGLLNNLS